MANYQYSSDLLDDILFRAGEPTDGTSDFEAAALRYLNRAYQAIWLGGSELDPSIQEDWWWLKKYPSGVLTLYPYITTGTVEVTNNSTAITFSSAPTLDLDYWYFQVDGDDDIFRISAHTAAAAAATLDSVYTGTTNTTATYKAFKLDYDLASDALKIISPMRAYQDSVTEVDGIDQLSMDLQYPLAEVESGTPTAFCMADDNTVRFNKYGGTSSTEYIRVEYDYLYRPDVLTDSGSQEPVLPWHYRKTLADAALYFLFMDKNDDRADAVGLMAKSGLRAMSRENRKRLASFSRHIGKILPRQGDSLLNARPLRTSSGLIIG